MRVVPTQFGGSGGSGLGPQHKQLLAHLIYLVENKYLGIHKSHSELLSDLGSAIAEDLSLDKSTNTQDMTDALRLACSGYKVKR